MKKFLIISLCFIYLFTCLPMLFNNNISYAEETAQEEQEDVHICALTLSKTYKSDASYHWRWCTKCYSTFGQSKHIYNKSNTACVICNNTDFAKHTCTPKKNSGEYNGFKANESYHWYVCEICNKAMNFIEHEFNGTSTVCKICGCDITTLETYTSNLTSTGITINGETGNETVDEFLNNGGTFDFFDKEITLSSTDTASILNMVDNEIGSCNNIYQVIAVLHTLFNIQQKYNQSVDEIITKYFSEIYKAGYGGDYDKSNTLNYHENTLLAFDNVINNSPNSQEVRKVIRKSTGYAGYTDLNLEPSTYYHDALSSYVEKGTAFTITNTVLECTETYKHDIFAEAEPLHCMKCRTYISSDNFCWSCENPCCNTCGTLSYKYPIINGKCSNSNSPHLELR